MYRLINIYLVEQPIKWMDVAEQFFFACSESLSFLNFQECNERRGKKANLRSFFLVLFARQQQFKVLNLENWNGFEFILTISAPDEFYFPDELIYKNFIRFFS